MRNFAIAIAALFVSVATAVAATGGFVGNTIHSSTAGFGELSFYVDPDGTYRTSAGGSGSWSYDGDILCFDDLCGPFDGSMGPGDSWEDVAWDGNGMAQLSIEEGDAL